MALCHNDNGTPLWCPNHFKKQQASFTPLRQNQMKQQTSFDDFFFFSDPLSLQIGSSDKELNVRFTYPCNFGPIGNFTPLENFLIVSAFVTSWVSKGPIYLDIGLHMLCGETSLQVWFYNLKHFRMSQECLPLMQCPVLRYNSV